MESEVNKDSTQHLQIQETSALTLGEHLKLREAHDKLHELHNATHERLSGLERRVQNVEEGNRSDSDSDAGSDYSDVEDDYELGYEENTIPEVRDVNFEQFKNRYAERDGKFCIEVLVAGSNFEDQVRQELRRRGELHRDDAKPRANYDESDERIIQRVRIQSPVVLWLLHHVLDDQSGQWRGQNRTTFFRPFAWFIHAHERMAQKLGEFENRFSQVSPDADGETVKDTYCRLVGDFPDLQKQGGVEEVSTFKESTENTSKTAQERSHKRQKSLPKRVERDILEKALLENYHSLLELRCYVNFVEQRILPQKTSLLYYVVDFNGEAFGATEKLVTIPYFDGMCDVTSLQTYPLRFHPDPARLLASLQENGRSFLDAVQFRHMFYRGWSRSWIQEQFISVPPPRRPPLFEVRPRSPPISPNAKIPGPQPPKFSNLPDSHTIYPATYIESDVIIDVKESFRAFPDWQINLPYRYASRAPPRACQDTIEIIWWTDKQRSGKILVIQDRTQAEDSIAEIEEKQLLDSDLFAKPQKEPNFDDENLLLLPRRLFGYALRERKFFQVDVQYLRKIKTDSDSFESLKINPGHIRIVKSVVSSHFQRKEMESIPGFLDIMDQDLIRGKGRGLVILLHGAPGVGKTATAEAVASSHNKPLFVITCGDLGFSPKDVESSLSEIFRLAHLWNCILLLDEADVFLAQREANALSRNALVSVFLRVLEYYNGILFLTTNRVGTLDEAFKSRVHLSLYYPALDRNQTEDIIRMNLVRLKSIEEQRSKVSGQKAPIIYKDKICKFAVDHWDRHAINDGQGRWNGRQIRNAVQIAASLAWYERKVDKTPGTEELPPILDDTHFATVENTMSLFEGYMAKTKGGTDTFISHQRAERYDKFEPPEVLQPPLAPRSTSYGGETGEYHPYSRRQTTLQPTWQQQQRMPTSTEFVGQHRVMKASQTGAPAQLYNTNPQQATHSGSTFLHAAGHSDSAAFAGQAFSMDSNVQRPAGANESRLPGTLYPQSPYAVSGTMAPQVPGARPVMGGYIPLSSQQLSPDPFGPRTELNAAGPLPGQESHVARAEQ
ncbi:hypothetical protein JX265_011639 [Neoarthrinium moseri]|uniref:AAA+ ATPase domain-containing protein n=1 Tax=Neoarthrinium moseri TaxID=1658444 RepID=A0A9P9WBM2_9PEZI|nr:hypothetical protein JX265_011639 [Neoarthrinium moseri]